MPQTGTIRRVTTRSSLGEERRSARENPLDTIAELLSSAATEPVLTNTNISPEPKRIRILLVEDHPETRSVLERLLRRRSYEVSTADSVSRALELISDGEFDLLVSDIGLPDGLGYDIMQHIRAIGKPLCGIALTGYGSIEDQERSRAAGFSWHLTKPISIRALDDALGFASRQCSS